MKPAASTSSSKRPMARLSSRAALGLFVVLLAVAPFVLSPFTMTLLNNIGLASLVVGSLMASVIAVNAQLRGYVSCVFYIYVVNHTLT